MIPETVVKGLSEGLQRTTGSREGSDIDLSLSGDISFTSFGDIVDELEELLLAYTIDVAVYDHLNNEALTDHIRRVGKVFWEQGRQ